MNILILDFLPLVFCGLAVIYFALQLVRWAERGKYRWIVYGLMACLGVWAFTVAKIQVEALRLHDQAVAWEHKEMQKKLLREFVLEMKRNGEI